VAFVQDFNGERFSWGLCPRLDIFLNQNGSLKMENAKQASLSASSPPVINLRMKGNGNLRKIG